LPRTAECTALRIFASKSRDEVIGCSYRLGELLVRPYRVSRVNNDLQLLALVCLAIISVLNAAQSAFESAGVDADQYPALASLVRTGDLLMFLLLLPPPLLLLYYMLHAAYGCHRRPGAGAGGR
jgi:hypothetical protein